MCRAARDMKIILQTPEAWFYPLSPLNPPNSHSQLQPPHSKLAILFPMRFASYISLILATVLALPYGCWAMATADYETILNGKAPRDSFVMYSWSEHPDVVIVHFDSYLYQSRALSRMAMYQEMSAARGRIMSQAELEEWFEQRGSTLEGIFGAHDYETEDLAGFYNALWQSGEAPYDEELALADALVAEGLLQLDMPADGSRPPATASPYRAVGDQAVLSFATRLALRESASRLQGKPDRKWEAGALQHELLHGIFFTEEAYAARCTEFWQQRLSDEERECLRIILASLNYDPGFEELMVNEFQAYLLTPEGPGMGPRMLLGRGKLLLSTGYRSEHVSTAKQLYFNTYGEALLQRIENGLDAELRDWLGE